MKVKLPGKRPQRAQALPDAPKRRGLTLPMPRLPKPNQRRPAIKTILRSRRHRRAPVTDAALQRASWAKGERYRYTLWERLRIGRRLGLMLVPFLLLVGIHAVWRQLGSGSPIPRLMLRLACRACGVRVRRHGKRVRRNVVFIPNHVSWLDIAVIGGTTGSAFVAKAELAGVPFIGWLCGQNRTVFVKREDTMRVGGHVSQLRKALEDLWSVTIFPEATTTDGQSLLPFKSAMLSAAEGAPEGMTVQPLLLDYGNMSEWIGWIGEEHGANNSGRILARPGRFTCDLHFLEPLDPRDYKGRKEIAAECHRRIKAALAESLGAAPRPFAYHVASIGYVAPEG